MPADVWQLTPAEIIDIVEARTEAVMQDRRFFDTLNGMFSAMYASAHGVKDAKPRDYMITPEETETIREVPATPETIAQKLKLMAASGLMKAGTEDK